jgi:chemotaxis protein methyltransferase CheR
MAVLSDATFQQLAELIYQRTGIFIPHTKKYLIENRLAKLIDDFNLKGYDEFLYFIKYSPNGKESERLFDSITTNETYFFREPMQFDVFIDHAVPRVLQNRRGLRDIRVWSAACSSGEEPYTLAMLMREKRFDVRAEIMASDISHSVLRSAARGLYSSYSIRNVPDQYMKKYFTQEGQDYHLNRHIIGAVKFRNLNLVGDLRSPDMRDFDIVFCRNVLIYFDQKAKQKAVSFLYDSLRPGGLLFIGSSESLHNVTRAFRPMTIDKVVVYEKV